MRAFARLAQLQRPRAWFVLGCVVLLLVLPSVFSGFSTDDHWLRYELSRTEQQPGTGKPPFELFRWFDAAHVKPLVDDGMLPWWTHERALMAFMRPVSSLTHTIDHALWPDSAFAMHLQNLLWFAVLVWAARRLYCEVIERSWVAAVASAFFALNHAHGVAIGWISNRNALLGAVFGTISLLCHHRWRSGSGHRYGLFALVSLALSVLSTEAGVTSACYLVAYALLYDRGARLGRVATLVPYGAVLAVWAAARHAGGYGTYGMGGYIDPLQTPVTFLLALPERVSVIFASQLAAFSADVYAWAPAAYQKPILGFLLAGMLLAAWWGFRCLRQERSIRFFAVGACLSTLPLVAALPSDRLLAPIGLGLMPFLAHGVHDALEPLRDSSSRTARLRSALAVTVAGVHFAVGPLVLAVNAYAPALVEGIVASAEESAPVDPALAGQTLIVADLTESVWISYLGSKRALNGRPKPEHTYWLGATHDPVTYERIGQRTLRVHSERGLFDDYWIDRAATLPLQPGDRVELAEMDVLVREVTSDGRPKLTDFVFKHALESERYRWVAWKDGKLEPFALPQIEDFRAARQH